MPYINQKQYYEQRNLRDMIDGELNRIAVTHDLEEIDKMVNCLLRDMIDEELNCIAVTHDLEEIDQMVNCLHGCVLQYAQMHRDRINGVYKK